METTLANLSSNELENLIATAIDRRMEVWLTQLLDAIGDVQEEDKAELQPEFEDSLKAALRQAEGDEVVSLDELRRVLSNG